MCRAIKGKGTVSRASRVGRAASWAAAAAAEDDDGGGACWVGPGRSPSPSSCGIACGCLSGSVGLGMFVSVGMCPCRRRTRARRRKRGGSSGFGEEREVGEKSDMGRRACRALGPSRLSVRVVIQC